MTNVRIESFSISLDGYGAGLHQDKENPLGIGGEELHEWIVGTRFFKQMGHREGGSTGVDNDYAMRGMENVGAWIMGRNMFGPVRGPWPDESWTGWWGSNPPYHVPVFVLTHHARRPQEMEGDTTFHFVTDGIHAAFDQARRAAGAKDIRIGGGTSVIRQFFQARLIDRAHLAIAPILLGSGEPLFAGLDLPKLGYRVAEHTQGEHALHVVLERAR